MKEKTKIYVGNIYKFTNKLNNKTYIGQSRCIERRYIQHVFCKNPVYELDRAIKLYGIDNFDYSIIETFSSENLDEVNEWMDKTEEFYIKKYNSLSPNGYNLLSNRNHPEFSEITRKRISEACKGEKNGFYGKKHTSESREKMRISAAKRNNENIGKHVRTEENIENWRNRMNDYYKNLSEEEKINNKIKQREGYKKWRESLTAEEYNIWNDNRNKKAKETKLKRQQEGKIYKSTKGKKAINNGIIGKKVYLDELEKYLNNGWVLGALWKNTNKLKK